MEKLKIKSEIISLEEQLEILERAKEFTKPYGLCCAIRNAMALEVNIACLDIPKYKDYIPLFTRENAIKYGGGRKYKPFWWSMESRLFWWSVRPYDFESRIIFLDWIIEQIKKEIENDRVKRRT